MTNQLSNWGRWGTEDEQGALNLITPDLIKQAAGLIRTGKVYSLTMPLEAEGPQWPSRHKTWKTTRYGNDPTDGGWADDIVSMHSHSGTHIDALCHVWYHNQLYNGFDATEHISSDGGGTRNAIENVPAIVGRGILLDIAGWKGVDHLDVGEPISAADLDACAASQNVDKLRLCSQRGTVTNLDVRPLAFGPVDNSRDVVLLVTGRAQKQGQCYNSPGPGLNTGPESLRNGWIGELQKTRIDGQLQSRGQTGCKGVVLGHGR